MNKIICYKCKKPIRFWQEYEMGWIAKGELGRDIYHKKCKKEKENETKS